MAREHIRTAIGENMVELDQKQVTVVGLKRTGVALAHFLAKRHARVTVTDASGERELFPYIEKVKNLGIRFELGGHRIETFESSDLIIVSPGVPHSLLPIRKAVDKGIPVIGEIELAFRFIREPIIAVTGTNGKTTTTELLGDIFRRSGKEVFVGGNIGNPLISYVDQPKKAEIIVAEISSFQLDTVQTFRPAIAILLNVTDDHLDRYPDFDAYASSKMRIFSNQTLSDKAILNTSDPTISRFLKGIKSRMLNFDSPDDSEPGATIEDDAILFHLNGVNPQRLDVSGIRLKGRHNLENISAAGIAALTAGVAVGEIQSALRDFKGLSHRLEYVKTINGVKFFDDSKGTNVDAVKKAIQTFDDPIVLIMGGRDKGGNFLLLKDELRRRVKCLVGMGEAQQVICSALNDSVKTLSATDMKDAVAKAYACAERGDIVLLSPGCASFDMYNGYAERGEAFKKSVCEMESVLS